ncbi:uncharacterized protein IUM83_06104 [Phytophthora cinnamomi]|uniref:uncharacterized protein n=1 Tax=Phytophthora cinnamomi TaxID=4785 RepID=UPI00355A4A05|nr:hypothetical protein IUM83_06104 [Phytophthora cinnamomi]
MDTPGLWKSDGRYGRKKNIICDWELVHRTRTEPIKKGQSTIQLNTVEGPVWMSPSIPLENVDSVKMFRECTLKITIKRRRRWFSCRKAKEIGRGEHSLEHLDVDAGFCGSKDLQVSVSSKPSIDVSCQFTIVTTSM